MRRDLMGLLGVVGVFTSFPAIAATIEGHLKDADGHAIAGVFVAARDASRHKTVYTVTDAQGRYRLPDLPDATYSVSVSNPGYDGSKPVSLAVSGSAAPSADLVAKAVPLRWSELSSYEERQLLPKTPGHDLSHADPFFRTCMESCHSVQQKMATQTLDKAGWRAQIDYMRSVMLPMQNEHLSDDTADDFASYLATAFGPNSPKPASPSQSPLLAKIRRPVPEEASNIVYVEYDFPAPAGIGPWSGAPDRDGNIWIPYYGRGNAVARLDPRTGKVTSFPLSSTVTQAAGIHSAVPAPDGTVWFTEFGRGRIGHLDPKTGRIVEYQNTPLPDGRRTTSHTIRVDSQGHVWTSGGPAITEFDPATIAFKHFVLPGTYGVEEGRDGDIWFTDFRPDGPIARVTKSGELQTFHPPTKGKPQRLAIDHDGVVWFTERQGNKIGRLDPATGQFKEFPLPGAEGSPYAIAIGSDGSVWASSHEQDTLDRMNPETGKVIEYPFPHAEISMRELFHGGQGRIWYASSVNNKVGYFYLKSPEASAQ